MEGQMEGQKEIPYFTGPFRLPPGVQKDQMIMVRQRYQLIPSRDIDDKKILKFNCTRCTPGHSQPRVLIATFPWWLLLCIKSEILSGSSRSYCWSKNPVNQLSKKHNWPYTQTKQSRVLTSLDEQLHELKTNQLIFSSDIVNQRILQSDLTRGTT